MENESVSSSSNESGMSEDELENALRLDQTRTDSTLVEM